MIAAVSIRFFPLCLFLPRLVMNRVNIASYLNVVNILSAINIEGMFLEKAIINNEIF